MNVISKPSPNFDSRDGHEIDMLVLHYTGMASATQALERLCDPEAKVSAHYVVDEDGMIYKLVEENERAWHAGVSYWRGNTNINQRSIGIEIVNPGHEFGYRPFPKAQMEAVAKLCKDIIARHKIPARNVVGHSDVAPERKEDPGELFDWKFLAEKKIGIWPDVNKMGWWNVLLFQYTFFPLPKMVPKAISKRERIAIDPLESPEKPLAQYGYDTTNLPKTIMAFQRHFRPKLLSGQWDRECALILHSLLDSVK